MPPLRPVTSQVAAEIGYDPAGGTDPGPFTQQVAERLHAADPRWGRRINSTGPISDDTVAYRVGTSPVNPLSIDIVRAAHTTHARLQWHTYDHWAETPGAHPTISRYISDPFFCSRAPRRRRTTYDHWTQPDGHAELMPRLDSGQAKAALASPNAYIGERLLDTLSTGRF